MAKKKKKDQEDNKLQDLKEAEQDVNDNERAELEAEHERLKAETEEAETAAADLEEEQAEHQEEDAEVSGAQAEADTAHERIQQVEDDYANGPYFDTRNIVSEHGEWAVTHQGISHLYYEIHLAADLLNSYNEEHVRARFPYTNADEFGAALEAAKEYHEGVEGGRRVYNPNVDFEEDYTPNASFVNKDDEGE